MDHVDTSVDCDHVFQVGLVHHLTLLQVLNWVDHIGQRKLCEFRVSIAPEQLQKTLRPQELPLGLVQGE